MTEPKTTEITDLPIHRGQEILGLTQTYRALVEEALGSLLDKECNGVYIIGEPYTGKSYLLDAILSNWDSYMSKVSGASKTFFTTLPNSLESKKDFQAYVAKLRKEVLESGYTDLCLILDSPVTGYLAEGLGVHFIVEADRQRLMEFMASKAEKIPDVQAIDVGEVYLSKEELAESLYLRRNYKELNPNFRITRNLTKNYLELFDKVLQEDYSITVEELTPGIPCYIFNKLILQAILNSEKPTKTFMKNFLNERGSKELASLLSQHQSGSLDARDLSSPEALQQLFEELGIPANVIRKSEISEEDMAAIMAGKDIDPSKISSKKSSGSLEFNDPDLILESLKEKVIGQDKALKTLSESFLDRAAGIVDKEERGPIASFLLLGPTGVGKSETARQLAKVLYKGEEVPLIQIDMSEYQEQLEAIKLYGAPPGYIGHGEGGILTNLVSKNPRCVLMLDEADKAHPSVWDKFLQVFEDARMTDGSGKVTDFSETVIIMTSNLGAEEVSRNALGFGAVSPRDDEKERKATLQRSLKKFFRPEFLNRITEIISFEGLTQKEGEAIARQKLEKYFSDVETSTGVQIELPEASLIELILKEADFRAMGGRSIKKTVKRVLGKPVSRAILKNREVKNFSLSLSEEGEVEIKTAEG